MFPEQELVIEAEEDAAAAPTDDQPRRCAAECRDLASTLRLSQADLWTVSLTVQVAAAVSGSASSPRRGCAGGVDRRRPVGGGEQHPAGHAAFCRVRSRCFPRTGTGEP